MSRTLYLSGPYVNQEVLAYLQSVEDAVLIWEEPIRDVFDVAQIDHVVSCNYKHLIPLRILSLLPPVVNLHISLLPWNRGSQPNFWSFAKNTVKGVTIHQVTKKVDGGPVYAQTECHFLKPERETLATTHAYLQATMASLFRETWGAIKNGECVPVPQDGEGSYQSRSDFAAVSHLLVNGWDTPVEQVRGIHLVQSREQEEAPAPR